MVTGITIHNDLEVFLFIQISLAVELPWHLHETYPPPVWGQLGYSYLVSSWKTPVFQDRGPNHEQIQWTPFHLNILCWYKLDYYLEVQPDSHKGQFCYSWIF